jgi:hypothetical protein
MPTMIQTIGLIFFDCGAGLAGKLAGWFAEAAAGCAPPTGFPHCAQKLLFTFAPQFVQNAIGLPLLLNFQPSVSRIRSNASTVEALLTSLLWD